MVMLHFFIVIYCKLRKNLDNSNVVKQLYYYFSFQKKTTNVMQSNSYSTINVQQKLNKYINIQSIHLTKQIPT